MPPTNILLIGNPGTGKSTILNGLLGKARFAAGISFGSGRTQKFDIDKTELGDMILMDTPGLADVKLRKEAAEAITMALKQGGHYKVFFVLILQMGRVRPEDLTTMKLVLDAAPITDYGIIINQIPPAQYKSLKEKDTLSQVVSAIWEGMDEGKRTLRIHLAKRDDELEGSEALAKPLPQDLEAFIATSPTVVITPDQVSDVKGDEFEKFAEEYEQRLTAKREDLEKQLEGSQEEAKQLQDRISQQQEEMQKIHPEGGGDLLAHIVSAFAPHQTSCHYSHRNG